MIFIVIIFKKLTSVSTKSDTLIWMELAAVVSDNALVGWLVSQV
jgi:hypothetical protein